MQIRNLMWHMVRLMNNLRESPKWANWEGKDWEEAREHDEVGISTVGLGGMAPRLELRTKAQFPQMIIIVGTVVTVTKMSQEHGTGKRPWNQRRKELV